MRFRLVPRSMTLNCYKFEFSEYFAGFRRFVRQNSKTNEDTPMLSAQRCNPLPD